MLPPPPPTTPFCVHTKDEASPAVPPSPPLKPPPRDLSDVVTDCIVCFETFSEGTSVRRLICGHFFHVDCIDLWLMEKTAICPLCRHSFKEPEDCIPVIDLEALAEAAQPVESQPVMIDIERGAALPG
ncbi:hypothetical protein BDK51DRAFT_16872 [Blyttiomyces helicus]|uniref:RING-type domain-containing protein n=1 Tax=Blyttiomyces helicus TaxID=388810 RepID=A0A4P9VUN9_9FUNG|nr:hypothetical protein BDK51DRAFT_16872 [Blyttiomyces helicus]|eukprot:RKO83311.1 hypothetical protein BDK51DRAFT_16872 [Blyttiomyces helicus]